MSASDAWLLVRFLNGQIDHALDHICARCTDAVCHLLDALAIRLRNSAPHVSIMILRASIRYTEARIRVVESSIADGNRLIADIQRLNLPAEPPATSVDA
jgi:hypothetical protein